ncbi:MAG: hypothetical protein M5R42_15250 [Rhodocyclaceae bacterium]|nr:hypothetical protein [Rhodocyclaceae bacterium]
MRVRRGALRRPLRGAPVAVVRAGRSRKPTFRPCGWAHRHGATEAPLPEEARRWRVSRRGQLPALRRLRGGTAQRREIIAALEQANLRGLGGANQQAQVARGARHAGAAPDGGEHRRRRARHSKGRYFLEREPPPASSRHTHCCRAVGIERIYIYLRDEYAGLRAAGGRTGCAARGLPASAGTRAAARAGTYVCGEESAMIESIEGKRGQLPAPAYVAEVGLFGRPTLEPNMETLYWVREIVERGADWFASQGRHGRRACAFSVSGRVVKPGVHQRRPASRFASWSMNSARACCPATHSGYCRAAPRAASCRPRWPTCRWISTRAAERTAASSARRRSSCCRSARQRAAWR